MEYFGIDVESPLANMKVIASNEESREVNTFEDILSFLSQAKYRSAVFFSFNLQYDSEMILKLTNNLEFIKQLYFEGAAPKGIQYNENVRIRYIPSKFLRICFRRGESYHCVSLFDIAQFYGGWNLERCANKFLGKYKNAISGEQIGEQKGYYETNRLEVLEYCRKDAELTLELAMLMKKTVENVKMPKGNLTFRNPISQAKISEIYIKDNFKYPKIPEKIQLFHWLAERAYHGGIFSTEKRGFFDKPLYSYDINSAYPYEMDKLKHWANGRFVETKSADEHNTRYGWYLAEFNCDKISYPDYSHPYEVETCFNLGVQGQMEREKILVNPKRVIYPEGLRKQWITKIEYEWMLEHEYPVKFIGGFIWEQTKEEYGSPFSWLKDVYYARQKIKAEDEEDIRQYALKICMNGIYGKTAQKRKGIGALTNFFYASYITAGTRLQICDVTNKNNKDIVEIATDSILSLRKLSLPISNKFGDWSYKKYKKGLVIGSGIRQQWLEDGSFITHARGLTYKSDWDMLSEMNLKKNLDKDYLYFEKKRPIHIGEVIFHHKILSLKDLGVFTKVSKRLSVNTDKKRRWQRDYKNFSDLLNSEPMDSKPLRLGFDETAFTKQISNERAIAAMNRADLKRAREFRNSDIGQDIDPEITKQKEKDKEILNEMKRYMKQDRFAMEHQ